MGWSDLGLTGSPPRSGHAMDLLLTCFGHAPDLLCECFGLAFRLALDFALTCSALLPQFFGFLASMDFLVLFKIIYLFYRLATPRNEVL
jgi:hypothetical protein